MNAPLTHEHFNSIRADALIEPLISGESNGADGDSDWSRRRLDARAADALIAEAAPDLEATAQQFEAFAAAVPVLDHPDAKRELPFPCCSFVALLFSK